MRTKPFIKAALLATLATARQGGNNFKSHSGVPGDLREPQRTKLRKPVPVNYCSDQGKPYNCQNIIMFKNGLIKVIIVIFSITLLLLRCK